MTLLFSSQGPASRPKHEKAALAQHLIETMGLELSIEKTRVSDPTEGFAFLGHRVSYKWHSGLASCQGLKSHPNKRADIRHRVKQLTTRTTTDGRSVRISFRRSILSSERWGNYFRFCTGASSVRGPRRLRRGSRLALAHEETRSPQPQEDGNSALAEPYPAHSTCLAGGRNQTVPLSSLPIERFRRGWMHAPAYAMVPGEPDA